MSDNSLDFFSEDEVKRAWQNRRRKQLASFTDDGILPDSLTFEKYSKILGEQLKQKKLSIYTDQDIEDIMEEAEMSAGQTDCPCHNGCKVDHGVIRFAKTANRNTGGNEYVTVKEDTGTDVNWISPKQVDRLAVRVRDIVSPQDFVGFEGSKFRPTQEVSLTLIGQTRKSIKDVFLVGPDDFQVDGCVVGTKFIKQQGHVHVLFAERQDNREMNLVVQNKISETERATIRERKAEADKKTKELADRKREQRSLEGRPIVGSSKSASSASGSTLRPKEAGLK